MTAEQVVKNEFGEEVSDVLPSHACPHRSPLWILTYDCMFYPTPASLPVLQVLLSFGDKPQARHNADSSTPAAIKVCSPGLIRAD